MTAAKSTETAETGLSLPGSPPGAFKRIWLNLPKRAGKAALLAHLRGETPAEELAHLMSENGFAVSASTIRTYRRAIARQEQSTLE